VAHKSRRAVLTAPPASTKSSRLPKPWALIALAAALLILFAGKALTIDDPLFIWTAKHIQNSPLNPYGFDFNWFGEPHSMSVNVQNPPLTSYWLALVGMAGWNESWLHLTMIPWAIVLLWGVVRLAGNLGSDPFWAATLTLGTSAFLISATNLTCDVMMLALMVWSVSLWVEGLENERFSLLMLAALLGGLAALTKYFALSIIPLLTAYTGIRAFRRGKGFRSVSVLSSLVVTVAVIGAWHFWSLKLYGVSHVSAAAEYAKSVRTLGVDQLYSGITFLGGCLFWPLIFAVSTAKLQGRIALAIAAAAGPLGIWWVLQQSQRSEVLELNPHLYLLAAAFFAAGIAAVYLTCRYLRERSRDPCAWLLGLWVFGTIVFMVALNWTVAARNVLPLVPPVALLASSGAQTACTGTDRRSGSRRPDGKSRRITLGVAGATGLLVAVLAAYADFDWANSVKREAAALSAKYAKTGSTLFFQGHWGFQYYMMEQGGIPMDSRETSVPSDCVLIVPLNNTNSDLERLLAWRRLEDEAEPLEWKIRLTDLRGGAGFYSNLFGPLPLSFSSNTADRYLIFIPPD
jgi:4-amino-4-deoxy-L-arabinose transferase-like glycosyltransferase